MTPFVEYVRGTSGVCYGRFYGL